MRVRIRIREQLCLLITITTLLALCVLAVTAWAESHRFVEQTRASTLSVTANLKAAQISQAISLYRDIVQSVSTRSSLQYLLDQYNNGNHSEALLQDLHGELASSLAGGMQNTLLLQGAVFPRAVQPGQRDQALVNATAELALGTIVLPSSNETGTLVYLGDAGSGYPAQLYPNFTWNDATQEGPSISYGGRRLYYDSTLMLGPLYLNNRSALTSMTVAISNNTGPTDILGWLTVVLDARNLYNIANDPIGLGRTGETLITSAMPADNLFAQPVRGRSASENADVEVNFILPPASNSTLDNRHSVRQSKPYLPFPMKDYPCVLAAWSEENGQLDNAGSSISSHNEQGKIVSCGYAQVRSDVVDWVVILEQSHGEVVAPVDKLRDAVLIYTFAVLGAIILVCFPIAHFAVKPIKALRTATENSIMTYEAEVMKETDSSSSDPESLKKGDCVFTSGQMFIEKRSHKKPQPVRRREFQIPEKVPERRHLIQDELTDLTGTFNEMSDELKIQYARLEDRVKTRTKELEHSRDLARAADESKTLFIANVSHELRTPLNGIIGMCSIAMQEDEMSRIRQSLNIIYKSSDLLLHLLNDLLTFSRNSYGQQLSIEESVFRLEDIGTQIVSIFEKQARESEIGLKAIFIGSNDPRQNFDDSLEDAILANKDVGHLLKRVKTNVLARGPGDTGALRQMALRGDKNRILQVLMNLVSNSLKFTPANGLVEVRIICKGFVEQPDVEQDVDVDSGASTTIDTSALPGNFPPPALSSSGRELAFEFEVEDTGPGIPESMQKEVFKPFVQGDLALSRKHGGTGLGLAICAQLASLMRGSINLKSTVDIGSTFTVSLPLPYTNERLSSVAGSLKGDSQVASTKAPSMASSIPKGALSTRSPRPLTRTGNKTQLPSTRTSICSGTEEPLAREQPRVIGYSPLILTETRADTEIVKDPANSQATQKENVNQGHLESIESIQDAPETQVLNTKGVEKRPNSPLQSISISKPQNMKILVAEDNKVNQEVIMRMLKLEKVTDATLAEDGQKALDIIRESIEEAPDGSKHSPFQLIFMDIQMPNMDGIEATKQIRELGFDAPIVALTAFDHESNRQACDTAGMSGFLPKPLKRKPLREMLEQFNSIG